MDWSNQAAKLLTTKGQVAVMPTDTVYGLIARARDQIAVDRLYKLKDRHHKPGTIIAKNIDQLVELGLQRKYLKAAEQFWPGPVSVIIPLSNPDLNYLTQDQPTIAVRIPKDDWLQGLLSITGPLLTTSANEPSKPTSTNLKQARDVFGQTVDGYFDGGDLSGRKPSTIIRIIDDSVEVIRSGAIEITS